MYHRYGPNPKGTPQRQGKPTAGEMGQSCQRRPNPPHNRNAGRRQDGGQRPQAKPVPQPKPEEKQKKNPLSKEGILGFLPPALYQRDSKKILGLFSAEDLLLIALIFLLLDGENEQDTTLIYLLLYLLVSDYVELPF